MTGTLEARPVNAAPLPDMMVVEVEKTLVDRIEDGVIEDCKTRKPETPMNDSDRDQRIKNIVFFLHNKGRPKTEILQKITKKNVGWYVNPLEGDEIKQRVTNAITEYTAEIDSNKHKTQLDKDIRSERVRWAEDTYVNDTGVQIIPPKYIGTPRDIRESKKLLEREEDEEIRLSDQQKAICMSKLQRYEVVLNNRSLHEQSDETVKALGLANDPPFLFVRGRSLCQVGRDENNIPSIIQINEHGLRGIIDRNIEFSLIKPVKNDNDEDEPDKAKIDHPIPPMEIIRDILNLPELSFPSLFGIIESPAILSNGDLLTKKGYNKETRFYYAPQPDLEIPDIPTDPTDDHVKTAIDLLNEIFVDFAFVDEASRANIIAALLTAVLRPMIKGPVPILLIDKPQAGTGASLISDVISLITTGGPANMTTAPRHEEEWKKMITSTLIKGRLVVVVDNIDGKIQSPSLAAVITSTIWNDRVLGSSTMISVPHFQVWIGTGNNIMLGGDMPRRCYLVRIDANDPIPWQRDTVFKHQDLTKWVSDERGKILAAILTLAKRWIKDGKKPPEGIPLLGSFEGWRNTIGGILQTSKMVGFLGNLQAMYEDTDVDTPQWEAFLERLLVVFPNGMFTVSEIEKRLKRETYHEDDKNKTTGKDSDKKQTTLDYENVIILDHERISEVLPDFIYEAWHGNKGFGRKLGRALGKINGRIFPNRYQVKKDKTQQRAVIWKVQVVVKDPKKKEDPKTPPLSG